jgi:hypothetical protein
MANPMNIDPEVIAKIAGPALSLIVGALIKHYTEARSKLVSFIGHASAFTLQGDSPTVIHTHTVVVRNAGRKAASNVRLTHAVLPVNITVYPPVQYSIERNPEGSGEIVIPVLVPREQVTVSYLYFPPLLWNQINVSTKSDEGFAKIINVIPMPQPNKAVIAGIWALVFVGASLMFYWLVRLAIVAI